MQIGVQMKAGIKPQLISIIYLFGMRRFECPIMRKYQMMLSSLPQ